MDMMTINRKITTINGREIPVPVNPSLECMATNIMISYCCALDTAIDAIVNKTKRLNLLVLQASANIGIDENTDNAVIIENLPADFDAWCMPSEDEIGWRWCL
jgi:hypothetical protein